ncbi:hypothetical protein PRUPE_2G054100 [Prunus persica]|uniref:Disease resistance N-terminal domain-containing protein n=1 Tax=Prunus persica TaxID=3760 RepID=A0A251QBQ6_PRUPE|nr:hypothetical protein PRUPE_2G054100 [Prunus persica]
MFTDNFSKAIKLYIHNIIASIPIYLQTLEYYFIQIPCREEQDMALIGEALISATIQTFCDKIASPEFTDLFRQKKLDEQLLNKLKTTLLTLSVVLNDAEEKQIKEPLVRDWLDNLRHNVLAAEDLLDEIDTEALRCKLEEGEGQTHNLTKKVRDFYQRMNVEMKDLLERLEQFVQEKSALGLREGAGRKVSQRRTTSLVHEPCVYGRDEVKENLLQRRGFAVISFSSEYLAVSCPGEKV